MALLKHLQQKLLKDLRIVLYKNKTFFTQVAFLYV